MKKVKVLLFVMVLMLLVSVFAVSCGEEEAPATEHTHAFKYDKFSVEPTETKAGKASGKCTVEGCSEKSEIEVPALTDTSVWKEKSKTDATCKAEGKKVYTSDYGDVTITLPKLTEHTNFDAWKIRVEPTETTVGSATRICKTCTDFERMELPVLTDVKTESNPDGFWTAETVDATCTKEGMITYYHGNIKTDDKGFTTADLVVKAELAKLPHNWSWEITTEPTLDTTGVAHRACKNEGCDAEETVDNLAVLTDTSVWTKSEDSYAPTHTMDGKDIYTSVYGTVEVTLDKLPAPFLNNSYYFILVEGNRDEVSDGVINTRTASESLLTLGADGAAFYTAYPMRGYVVITVDDLAAGKLTIKFYSATFPSSGEEGEPVADMESEPKVYTAYIDYTSSIITMVNRAANDLIVMVPATTPEEGELKLYHNLKVSVWNNNNTVAMSYTDGDVVTNIFVNNGVVTYGVTYTDIEGNEIAAEDCYNASYIYIKKGDELVASFGHDGTQQNPLDGLEGSYTEGEDRVIVSGFGTLIYTDATGTMSGTYTKAPEGADYDLDIYLTVDGKVVAYAQVTVGENKTYTKVLPEVTITFDGGDYATIDPELFNTNVPIIPPAPYHDEMILVGWMNGDEMIPAGTAFIPKAEATLTAVWDVRCVITLGDVMDGDATRLDLYPGIMLDDVIPQYVSAVTMDMANNRYFVGWFVDANGNGVYDAEDVNALPEEYELTAEDTAVAIVAAWKEIPAYYGTYGGSEYYYQSGGGSYGKEIQIDLFGAITGAYTGNMSDYNAETKTIMFGNRPCYFDIEAGVMIVSYSSSGPIKISDAYVFFKGVDKDNLPENCHYGFKLPGSSTVTERLFMFNDGVSDRAYLVRADKVYANVVVTNALGISMTTMADVFASKTMIIFDSEGNQIVALASDDVSFDESNSTEAFGELYGTYTLADSDLVVKLDGAGNILYDGKVGTYTLNGTAYDVYLANGTEFYTLTIDAENKTYTMVKNMVEVTFDGNMEGVTVDAVSTNKNVPMTLPVPTKDGYVFRGWYIAGAEDTLYNDTYIPADAVAFIAKWDATHSFKANYNDGVTDALESIYGEGDIIDIEKPLWSGHRFLGWYTTADFQEGTEWTSGTAMGTADVEIFAKWGEPVKGWGTYFGYDNSSEVSTSTNNGSHFVVFIDEEGNVTGKFTGSLDGWDPETKLVKLKRDGSSERTCYFDPDAGILICAYAWTPDYANDAHFFVKVPADTADFTMAHYGVKNGSSIGYRFVTYTYGDVVASYLLTKNTVYANVTMVDAFGTALDVTTLAASKTVIFMQGETIIAKLAAKDDSFSGGSNTVAMDEVYGTYTLEGSDVVVKLDGAGNIVYGDKTGTYALNEGNLYDVYFAEGTEYYALTVDASAKTYTIEKTMVTITYNTNQDDVTEAPITTNKNIVITLPTLVKDGFVFRGWYVEGAEATILTGSYIPTETVTLLAKWDKIVTVTVQLGNGLADVTKEIGEGDDITAFLAETAPKGAVNGKAFQKWTVGGEDYTGGAVTDSITVICVWMDAVDEMGTYKVYEVWSSSVDGSNGVKPNIVIDAIGATTGFKSGTILYDEAGNAIGLKIGSSTYFATFAEGGDYDVFAWAYGASNPNSFGTDLYIGIKGVSTLDFVGQSVFNSGTTRIVEFSADGTTVFVLVHADKVYANVSVVNGDGVAVTAKAARNESVLVIKDATGASVATLVNKGNNVWEGLDGTEGTYTGNLGEIVSAGTGFMTVAGTTVTYILDAGKLGFNLNNKYTVIALGEGTYTVVADGLAGTYTLPDASTYVLNGFGVVTGVGTYTYADGKLTVYVEGGESAIYGIDVENKQLLSKSAFAGLTFEGKYGDSEEPLEFVFDDASTISGVFYVGGKLFFFNFTGVLEGNTLTLTITTAVDKFQNGKVVVATIAGDTLTITQNGISNGAYQIQGGTATCPGFSL